MFGSNVKLDKALLAKVKRYADLAGYSSVDEFITHALEKEVARLETADSDDGALSVFVTEAGFAGSTAGSETRYSCTDGRAFALSPMSAA